MHNYHIISKNKYKQNCW